MRRRIWLTGVLIAGTVIVGVAIVRSGLLSGSREPDRRALLEVDRGITGASTAPRPSPAGLVEALRSGESIEEMLPESEDTDPEDLRVLTRAMLEDSIETYLPGYKLSSDELDRLAEAASRIREAQNELRDLPEDPDLADQRRKLKERIEDSIRDFTEIMDMDPSDFTAAVQPGVGIDAHDPDEIVPEGEFIEGPERIGSSQ